MGIEETYCSLCKQLINPGVMGFFGQKFYKFEDGIYCEKCAKVKVDKARRSI